MTSVPKQDTFIYEGGNAGPLWLQVAANLGFVICCAAGCMGVLAAGVLAAGMRFATRRRAALDSLSGNAYGMYLIHYPFVVWMQYLLLSAALPAIAKAAIVFAVAVALSWVAAAGLRGIPISGRLFGGGQRTLAKAP